MKPKDIQKKPWLVLEEENKIKPFPKILRGINPISLNYPWEYYLTKNWIYQEKPNQSPIY